MPAIAPAGVTQLKDSAILPDPPSAPPPSLRPGVKRFDDTATEGYGWTQDGALNWPGKDVSCGAGAAGHAYAL